MNIDDFHRSRYYDQLRYWDERRNKFQRQRQEQDTPSITPFTPLRLYYFEFSLNSANAKVFVDFTDSRRNTYEDSEVTASNIPEKPLRQIQVINDGTADYIRVGINEGNSATPYLKIKFAEGMTIPFVGAIGLFHIYDMVIHVVNTNSNVRVIGVG